MIFQMFLIHIVFLGTTRKVNFYFSLKCNSHLFPVDGNKDISFLNVLIPQTYIHVTLHKLHVYNIHNHIQNNLYLPNLHNTSTLKTAKN